MLGAVLRVLATQHAAWWSKPLPALTLLSGQSAAAAAAAMPSLSAAASALRPLQRARVPECLAHARTPVMPPWRSLHTSTSSSSSSSSSSGSSSDADDSREFSSSGGSSSDGRGGGSGSEGPSSSGGGVCDTCGLPPSSGLYEPPFFDPLQPPVEPGPSECCGRGCGELCVWTIYFVQRRQHEAAVAALAGEAPPEDPFEAMERRLAEQAAQRAAEQAAAAAAKPAADAPGSKAASTAADAALAFDS